MKSRRTWKIYEFGSLHWNNYLNDNSKDADNISETMTEDRHSTSCAVVQMEYLRHDQSDLPGSRCLSFDEQLLLLIESQAIAGREVPCPDFPVMFGGEKDVANWDVVVAGRKSS